MGLDATVRCNCWEEGRTSAPPVPRHYIATDEEDYLHLTLPYEGHQQQHQLFHQWKYGDACPHEEMERAYAHLGNWATYRRFQMALRHAGIENFPVLAAELPQTNGGTTSAQRAARALEELELLQRADLGETTYLLDAEDGTRLRAWSGENWFLAANPWRIGFDPHGFFVANVAGQDAREEFRAMRLTQEVLGNDLDAWDQEWAVRLTRKWLVRPVPLWVLRLRALDASSQIVLPLDNPIASAHPQRFDGPALWEPGAYYPRRLEVVTAPTRVEEHGYVLDGLTEVFRASVETGRPVQWC